MNNLTVQKIVIFLIVGSFFLLAPWMASEMLTGNPLPFFSLLAVGLLLLFLFLLKDRCWMVIPFTLPIEGRLMFLPLNFSMQETAVILVFAYLFIQIIMGRQIHWRLGPGMVWLPLSGLLAVLLFHWISSGDIGIKALGGTGWGGRKYFSILMAAATVPILISFSGNSWRDFQRIPLIYFAGVFVDLIPDTLTTVFPGTSPYIFRVYSMINISEFGKEIMGNFAGADVVTRYTTFRNLGQATVLLIMAYFPFFTWLNPARLWILPVLVLAFFATAFSGFRSAMFNYAIIFTSALFASARSKVFLLVPLAVGLAFLIASTQGRVFQYPSSIQRALSFLPGQWNPAVTQEATGSSEWRGRIRELFFKEYFHQAPLLGTGFGFDPNLAKKSTELFLRIAALREADEWADVRSFIEMKQPHEGDIHALSVSGIVGTAFFVFFCLGALLVSLRSVLRCRPKELSPIQIWSFAIICQQVFAFFSVFGDYVMTLSVLCPVISILAASEKLRPTVATRDNVSEPSQSLPPLPWPQAREARLTCASNSRWS